MSAPVLDFIRQKDPSLANAPDDELLMFLGQKYPDLVASDPESAATYNQLSAEKRNAQYRQATGFDDPNYRPARASLEGVAPSPESSVQSPESPMDNPPSGDGKPQLRAQRATGGPFKQGPDGQMVYTGAGVPIEDNALQRIKSDMGQAAMDDGDFLREHPELKMKYGLVTDMPMQRVNADDLATVTGLPKGVAAATAGVQNGIADVVDFMTSPAGVATIASGGAAEAGGPAFAALAHRTTAQAFAANMAYNLPEQFDQITEALEKGDTQTAFRGITGAAISLGVIGGAAKATVKGGVKGAAPGAEAPVVDPAELQRAMTGNQIAPAESPAPQDTRPVWNAEAESAFNRQGQRQNELSAAIDGAATEAELQAANQAVDEARANGEISGPGENTLAMKGLQRLKELRSAEAQGPAESAESDAPPGEAPARGASEPAMAEASGETYAAVLNARTGAERSNISEETGTPGEAGATVAPSGESGVSPAAAAPDRGGGRGGGGVTERPWDVIDEVESNLGGKISLEQARKLDPDFRPTGAARKLFAPQGYGVDVAAQAIEHARAFDKPDEFLSALNAAADARKAWRASQASERAQIGAEASQAERFAKDAQESSGQAESIVPDELLPGDTFKLKGETVTVKGFNFDEDGNVTDVTLEDGPKYGEQRLPAGGRVYADKGTVKEGATPAWEPETPSGKGGRVAAMGSAVPRPVTGPERTRQAQERTVRTTEQAKGPLPKASKELTAGIDHQERRGFFAKLSNFLETPSASDPGRVMKLVLRARMGEIYGAARRADFALKQFRKEFDKTPVARAWKYIEGMALPRNYEVQRAIDSGDMAALTPHERTFAEAARKILDEAIEAVQRVSPNSLRDLYENYFPRIWRDPVKNKDLIARWLQRRPLEGSKSFLKARILEDWMDGIRMGLVPAFDNPADMVLAKAGEMRQFAATREAFNDLKELGLRKFVYFYEQGRLGWAEINDPSSKVWAPPMVTIKEAFDAQVRTKTYELLEALGVSHERLAKLPGKRWGEAQEQGSVIRSKFGGPDFVLWHELGHLLRWKYPDLDRSISWKSGVTAKELRALADLRWEGQPDTPESFKRYVRNADEKYANILDAYIRAPGRFERVAPVTFAKFEVWLDEHMEVKVPLKAIRPSLTLGTGSMEVPISGGVQLGRWMSPEPVVRVANNYLSTGFASRKWYAGIRAINGLATSMRLLGFFHGGMVLNDAEYSGLSMAINDGLRGKSGRAAKELVQSPAMVVRAFRLGSKIKRGIENPAMVDATTRELAKYALEVNLRSHVGLYDQSMGRRWTRAANELLSAPSTGAAWETLWRAPFAAANLIMKPVMEGLVPRLKYGMHGLQTIKILADNPELEPMQLRNLLAKSADSVEDRIGNVTYDNIFMHRSLVHAGQLGLTAMGWHLTKYRGLFGAATDWTRAAASVAKGEKPEVTFRMTYLPAVLIGHAMIGGLMHYMMTGRRPKDLQDYVFPESGLVDPYGKPVRLAIADYVKDIARDVQDIRHGGILGLAKGQIGRLAPVWNVAAELLQNRDYWGTEIMAPRKTGEPNMAALIRQLGEAAKYLGQSIQPFSATAGQKLMEAGAKPIPAFAGPFFGIVPASKAVTQTPAEAYYAEAMRGTMPQGSRTQAQAEKSQAIVQLVKDARLGKVTDEDRKTAAGVTDKASQSRIMERIMSPPIVVQAHHLPLDKGMQGFDLANESERVLLAPVLMRKIQTAFEAGKLDSATTGRYVKVILPNYRQALMPPPAATPAPARANGNGSAPPTSAAPKPAMNAGSQRQY